MPPGDLRGGGCGGGGDVCARAPERGVPSWIRRLEMPPVARGSRASVAWRGIFGGDVTHAASGDNSRVQTILVSEQCRPSRCVRGPLASIVNLSCGVFSTFLEDIVLRVSGSKHPSRRGRLLG